MTGPSVAGHPSLAPQFTILSTNDTARQRYSTVLYKGAPITGKTHNIGTWTGAGPLLYILFDPKSETISQFPNVHIIAPKDIATFENVIIPRITTGTLTDAQGSKLDYASVALDSISFMAKELELSLLLADGMMPDGGWQRYAGRLGTILSRLGTVARTQDHPHPANFLATVHEQDLKQRMRDSRGNSETVSMGWVPKISGGLKDTLEGYFDLTLLTVTEQVLAPTDPKTPNAPRQSYVKYSCRTLGLEKRQQAGGSFRGVKPLPTIVDGTYQGLCALADKVGKVGSSND